MTNPENNPSLYLNNIKIIDFDTVSSKPYYRVVNDQCDIEINENVKKILDFVQSHEGESASSIIQIISEANGMNINNVEKTIQALIQKGVLSETPVEQKEIPVEEHHRNKMKYLWVRWRLLQTDKYERFFKSLSFVFAKPLAMAVAGLFVLLSLSFIILYFFTDWKNQLTYFSTYDYFFVFGVYSFILVIIHEIGHISAAKRYGSKTGGIGIGVYYYFLVFWADVHETWNLPRKQRMVVSIAGYFVDIIFVLPVFILCYYFQSKALADFIIVFLISALTVFNPFLKMDGYWFLCDLLGVPNLKTRLNDYLYKYLPAKIFTKNLLPDPFRSFPANTKKFIVGYTVLFYVFMIFFLSMFLSIAFRIVMNLESEFLIPLQSVIAEWNQDTGNVSGYFNQVLRNAMILFGAGMLLFNYVKRLIQYVISKFIKSRPSHA